MNQTNFLANMCDNCSQDKRCHTCEVVVGAIASLEALVLREPWLLTEGMAGSPEKAAWELEEAAEVEEEDLSDGLTNEQREEVRREAEEAVARRWEAMAAEQAAEEEAK
jgi:hypothetical protein